MVSLRDVVVIHENFLAGPYSRVGSCIVVKS